MKVGKIIDDGFVEVPRQRNHHEENKTIKKGNGEELWNEKAAKKRQKDIDARWTKKAVGIIRNTAIMGLMNLVYNMLRYEKNQRLGMN